MPKKVAITGGIGSGKSTVVDIIKELGFPIFSCDEIYSEIINSEEYIEKVKDLFPSVIENNQISRIKLAEIVFSNNKNRETLNAIAHPLIMKELDNRMNSCKENLVFAEVPLLFEGGYESKFDDIIVVIRDLNERISAICQRDNTTIEHAKKRIEAQFDYQSQEGQEKIKKCNAILLENNNDIPQLKTTINAILNQLT